MTNFSDDGNGRSMYTANCYLKSQGADFEGGAMRFYIPLESALSEVQRGAGGRHRAVEQGIPACRSSGECRTRNTCMTARKRRAA
jgi:hypothetical protein